MAVEVDGVCLVVWTRRVVHKHEVVVLQVGTDVSLIERERGELLRFHRFAVSVLACPGELRWRFAEADGEHVVDRGEHLRLLLLQRVFLAAFGGHVAELEAVFAEFEGDELRHARRVVGRVAFRHHLCRHESVFHHHVLHTAECAAIAEWVFEEPFNRLVAHGLRGVVDDSLEEEV